MGALTESMTHLRDEIVALRHSRQMFLSELARSRVATQLGVAALRRAWASDLAGARRAWGGTTSSEPPLSREDRAAAPSARRPAPAAHAFHRKKHKKQG